MDAYGIKEKVSPMFRWAPKPPTQSHYESLLAGSFSLGSPGDHIELEMRSR
jgi:hypothetical protein